MQSTFATQTLQILEIIGTVAFGASGLIAAARKKLAMVGVVLLVLVTAFGGGTLRDLLLNRHPFFWMTNEIWIWLLAALAIATQFLVKAKNVELSAKAIDWPDAI
ncbi:MAG: trimeric intracellular cation channel family protein, partial [Micrococcales bacterium]